MATECMSSPPVLSVAQYWFNRGTQIYCNENTMFKIALYLSLLLLLYAGILVYRGAN